MNQIIKCIEIRIKGKVEKRGLAFRSMNEASKYSLAGKAYYVGHDILTIEIEGKEDQLEQMLSWLSSIKLEKDILEVSFTESRPKNYNQFEISN